MGFQMMLCDLEMLVEYVCGVCIWRSLHWKAANETNKIFRISLPSPNRSSYLDLQVLHYPDEDLLVFHEFGNLSVFVGLCLGRLYLFFQLVYTWV